MYFTLLPCYRVSTNILAFLTSGNRNRKLRFDDAAASLCRSQNDLMSPFDLRASLASYGIRARILAGRSFQRTSLKNALVFKSARLRVESSTCLRDRIKPRLKSMSATTRPSNSPAPSFVAQARRKTVLRGSRDAAMMQVVFSGVVKRCLHVSSIPNCADSSGRCHMSVLRRTEIYRPVSLPPSYDAESRFSRWRLSGAKPPNQY